MKDGPFDDVRFRRFIQYLVENQEAAVAAARLQAQGVDLLEVFLWLRLYIEGRSLKEERRRHEHEHRKIVNRGVRSYGVPPEIGRWLSARSELAHSIDGWNRVRNIDSLAAVHLYMELRTGRPVLMPELTHLVDAAYYALGRKDVADSIEVGRELRRHRKQNQNFLKILKNAISKNLK